MGPDTLWNTPVCLVKELVNWLQNLTWCAFPRKPNDLPFKYDRPGKTWFVGFMKRNPELRHRIPVGISRGRAIATEESICRWFKVQEYMESEYASNVLLDPKRIFNCDETSFSMCPKTGKVIAPIGWETYIPYSQEMRRRLSLVCFSLM